MDPERVAALIPAAALAAFPPEDYRDYFNKLTDEIEEITGVRDPGLTMQIARAQSTRPADWVQVELAKTS